MQQAFLTPLALVLDVDRSVGERGPLLSAGVSLPQSNSLMGNRPESRGLANEEQRVDEERSADPLSILYKYYIEWLMRGTGWERVW